MQTYTYKKERNQTLAHSNKTFMKVLIFLLVKF